MKGEETLLGYLEERRGEFCSGEELSEKLGVSRTTIWKRIKTLEAQGHVIRAIRNRGYMLEDETDVVSEEGILLFLEDRLPDLRIEVVDETASTNLDLRKRAYIGEPDGLVLIARRQTEGRGRRGRSFFSPDSGVYLSMLLRPEDMPSERAARYTTIAAIAVCETIESIKTIAGVKPRIKWVNDVYVNDRKVCGILTEAQVGLEHQTVEYAVVGVGVNLFAPPEGFPEELRDVAGAVYDVRFGNARNRFIAEFLVRFYDRLFADDPQDDLEEYRRRLVSHCDATVLFPNMGPRPAKIVDVDDHYRLVVEYSDGSCAALSSGEVSVRPS